MKEKPEYYYRQSAVIPYYKENGRLSVVLITTKKKKKWTLPKGIVEPHLSAPESARREAYEEAGIEGCLDDRLFGRFEYKKWGGTCAVRVFLMKVTRFLSSWPEGGERVRDFFDPCRAPYVIGRKEIKPVLDKFCDHQDDLPL
jgi:phosphohistidine phosphatase